MITIRMIRIQLLFLDSDCFLKVSDSLRIVSPVQVNRANTCVCHCNYENLKEKTLFCVFK